MFIFILLWLVLGISIITGLVEAYDQFKRDKKDIWGILKGFFLIAGAFAGILGVIGVVVFVVVFGFTHSAELFDKNELVGSSSYAIAENSKVITSNGKISTTIVNSEGYLEPISVYAASISFESKETNTITVDSVDRWATWLVPWVIDTERHVVIK